MKINVKTPVLSAVAFFGTLGILSVGYSAYVSNYPATATAGTSQLSATEWNKMVTALQTLDTNLSNLSFSSGKVGIGTASPLRKFHVAGDQQLDGDLYGGLYGWTRGIWRFSSTDPNFWIFYTEASPDVISFSPNGGGTGSSVMAVTGYGVGIGTSAPSEKLELNGNLKFTANGSVISKAPRAIHSVDPVTWCPPSRAANADLWTMPVTLDRPSTVWLSGDLIKNSTLRADLQLYMDGSMLMQTIAPAVSNDWAWAHVQWSGTVAAGSHTVSLRSPQASVWGCWGSWWSMDALIFEN